MRLAEIISISLFVAGLLICVISGANILFALAFGLITFTCYALYKKHSVKEILGMMKEGIAAYKNILIIFMFIGMLTAVWRCAGTIPYIIYNAVGFIDPRFMVLSSFLLCSLMSVLTGTSFGTAGTMGVICMMISRSLGINPVLAGGAILAGAFFGDRCSPMSTSAMLVCALTDTEIYKNISNMIKTSIIPLVLTCIIYGLAGIGASGQADVKQTVALFAEHFDLSAITALPALLIVILLIARVKVKWAMFSSVIIACVIAAHIQGVGFSELLKIIVFGFKSSNIELAALLNGGGLVSMIRVSLIITISATYSGIFKHTPLLQGIKSIVQKWADILTPFGTVAVVSVFMSMISCNQTLATTLTHQTTKELIPDKYEMAVALENTSIVIAPLIPWSIAGAVPLSTIGAPISGMAAAVYLYLIPICCWIAAIAKKRMKKAK